MPSLNANTSQKFQILQKHPRPSLCLVDASTMPSSLYKLCIIVMLC